MSSGLVGRSLCLLGLLSLVILGTLGCFRISIGDIQLWPPSPSLTGRWEGTAIWDAGSGDITREITLILVEVDGGVTGSMSYNEGAGTSDRTISVIGTRKGSTVVLHATAYGSSLTLSGTITEKTIAGSTEFRGETHTWQVNRETS